MLDGKARQDVVDKWVKATGMSRVNAEELLDKLAEQGHVRHLWPLTVEDTKCLLSHGS